MSSVFCCGLKPTTGRYHTIQDDTISFEFCQPRKVLRSRILGSTTVMIESLMQSWRRGKDGAFIDLPTYLLRSKFPFIEIAETVTSQTPPLSLDLKVKFSIEAIKTSRMTPCQCPSSSRNLVVCIDGTAQQFSLKVRHNQSFLHHNPRFLHRIPMSSSYTAVL